MAISGSTVDIPLTSPDQQDPITTIPLGQLQYIENGVCKKYSDDAQPKIKVSKRHGFSALTNDTKNPANGLDADPMDNVKLLTTFADQQLLAIGDARPFVYAEHAPWWERIDYPILTQSLSQKFVHVDNSQDAIPDACCIGGIYLYTWATVGSSCWAKFVDDDGTPIRTPFEITSAGRIKCVSDGTYFWIFADGGTSTISAYVYGTDGVQVASTAVVSNPRDSWDCIFDATNGVNVVSLDGTGYSPILSKCQYSTGGGFTITPRTFSTINVNGSAQIGFLTNQTGDGLFYIVVLDNVDADDFLTGYKLPASGTTVLDTWEFSPQFDNLVNVAGYAYDGGNVRVYASNVDVADQLNNYSHVLLGYAGGAVDEDGKVFGATVASRAFNIGFRETHAVVLYYASRSSTVNLAGTGGSIVGQPTYFIHDMESKKVVGRFNYGTAAMDWPTKTPEIYTWHLPTPFIDGVSGKGFYHVSLGVNGESIVQTVTIDNHVNFSLTYRKFANTVGVMDTMLGAHGTATEYASELFIPGPVATVFTGSDFAESGVNLSPEQPDLVPEAGTGHLATNRPYSYVVVYEWTNPNGERARSQATVPVTATLFGSNNQVQLTGRYISLTGHRDLIISIYRNVYITASVTGVNSSATPQASGSGMSIEHYKITSDLDPLYNDPNADPNTWTYTDGARDQDVAVGEQLYTDQGFLQRDPAPAHSTGCISDNRVILAGYDNALWISGEKTPGEALWFNGDALRITMPTDDPIRAVLQMDNRLYIGCSQSWWWVPSTGFPDATGQNGNIRTPERLPFNNGCTGPAKVTKEGILYASSIDGQPWLITREMTNIFAGSASVEDFTGVTVTGMATDADQKTALAVTQGPGVFSPYLMVWDPLPKTWSKWKIENTAAYLPVSFRGRFHFYDSGTSIWRQIPGQWYDNVSSPIITKLKVGPVHLGGVKNFKRIWDIVIYGEYRDDHNLKVTIDYNDNGGMIQTPYEFQPSSEVPYLYKLRPTVPLCSSMSFTFEDSFPRGISEGFSLEMISFYVALEAGLARMPSGLVIPAGTTSYIVPGVSGMDGTIVTVDEVTDLKADTVGGVDLVNMASGRTIAWVKDVSKFYVLDENSGTPENPPTYDRVDASDDRQWFLT